MNCRTIQKKLIDYVLSRTNPKDSEAIQKHVNKCKTCQEKLDETIWLYENILSASDILEDTHLPHRLLLDYHETPDSIEDQIQEEIRSHLICCTSCTEIFELIKRLAAIPLIPPQPTPASFLRRLKDRFFWKIPRFATVAAVLLIIVAAVVLLRQYDRRESGIRLIAASQKPNNSLIYHLIPTIAEPGAPTLEGRPLAIESWNTVVLLVPVEVPSSRRRPNSIEIRTASGARVWNSQFDSSIVDQGFINIAIEPGSLPHGTYRIATRTSTLVPQVVSTVEYLKKSPLPSAVGGIAFTGFEDPLAADSLFIAGMPRLLYTGISDASSCYFVDPARIDYHRTLLKSEDPSQQVSARDVARSTDASVSVSAQRVGTRNNAWINWQIVNAQSGETVGSRQIPTRMLMAAADSIIARVLDLFVTECRAVPQTVYQPVSDVSTPSEDAYRHYLKGVLASESLHINEAESELKKAVTIDSTFALAYLELARLYYSNRAGFQQNRDKAQDLIAIAMRHSDHLGEKDRLRLESWRAFVHVETSEAIAILQSLLKRWPDDREVLTNLADALAFFWEPGPAGEVAKQALEYYPNDPNFLRIRRNGLNATGNIQDAYQIAKYLVDHYPEQSMNWHILINQYLIMGEIDSMGVTSERAKSVCPDYVPSETLPVTFALARGDFERAIAVVDSLASAPGLPARSKVHYNLYKANLIAGTGRLREAIAVCEDTRSIATGKHLEEQVKATILTIMLGADTLWAKEVLEKAAANILEWGGEPRMNLNRTQALVLVDSLDTVIRESRELLADETHGNGPQKQQALNALIDIAIKQGRAEDALQYLDRLEKRGIWRPAFDLDFRLRRVRAYRLAGRYQEALKEMEHLLKTDRYTAKVWYELGITYEQMADTKDAINAYNEFLHLWSDADTDLPQLLDAQKRLNRLVE